MRTAAHAGERRRGERGSAVIELALFLTVFGPVLIFGTAEVATVTYASIEVANAAHAGAMYGMQSTTAAADTSTIQSAAQGEAADFGTSLTVTPTTYYACATAQAGTQYTTQSAATTGCTGTGNHALQFLSVTATVTVTPPFRIPGLMPNYNLSSVSVMQVQQ